ncbi:MAG: hypothetical protein ACT4QC_05380 [Planctomycetaceae bacterium]
MDRLPHLLIALSMASGGLFCRRAAAGDHCRRAAPDRGLAIRSPLECPDPCDSPVGGRFRCTPYYPGYMPDRRCCLWGATVCNGNVGPNWRPAGAYGTYGAYSGARSDETNLRHLGGFGPGAVPAELPNRGVTPPTSP